MKYSFLQRLGHSVLAMGILVCFVFTTSALTTQTVQHSVHHAHHKATTHASNICSWMCAAGQVLQTFDFTLRAPIHTIVPLEAEQPLTLIVSLNLETPSRAPPPHTSHFA